MAHDVFISYAAEDKAVADAVCGTLEANGIRCWIAPRDVLPGVHYGEAIIDAIEESRIMVLVFSSKANRSAHIPKEIERAVSKSVTVMPLRIEDVAPGRSLDYFIGSVHWLDALTPPLEVHLKKLATNVQTLLARSAQAAEVRPRPPIVPPPDAPAGGAGAAHPAAAAPAAAKPTWMYAVIGGLIVVVLVLGGIMYWSRSQSRPSNPQPVASAPAPAATPAQAATAAPKESGPAPTTPASRTAETPAPPKAAAAPAAKPLKPDPVLRYFLGSSIKLEQLVGDMDKQLHKQTLSRTGSRFGVHGADLGSSFEHQGRLYFLFGDTMGRLGPWRDVIGTSDASEPEAGVRVDLLTLGDRTLTIEPTGVRMGAFEVPVAGISLNGKMYVVVSTNHTTNPTDRSVLTRFIAPSTFEPLRTLSELPAGKFVRMSLHSQAGAIAGLPPGGPFVFMWGTGNYRKSDAYLAIVPVSQFESGKGTRYFAGLDAAGKPRWSTQESEAQPVVENGTLGDLSVTWCKDLDLWLMTYDSRPPAVAVGIVFSYSRTPWGPWHAPQLIFNGVRDGGFGKFIHQPGRRPDDGLAGPVIGPANQANPGAVSGGLSAPYVIERWTKVRGSELDLYYVMSTWNPYVVVLMKSRLQIE